MAPVPSFRDCSVGVRPSWAFVSYGRYTLVGEFLKVRLQFSYDFWYTDVRRSAACLRPGQLPQNKSTRPLRRTLSETLRHRVAAMAWGLSFERSRMMR